MSSREDYLTHIVSPSHHKTIDTGFRLNETDAVVAAGRAAGPSGDNCTSCTGEPSLPDRGFRATVRGTVSDLGDSSSGTVGGTPLLSNVEIGGDECEVETVPPGCPATTAQVEDPPADGGGVEDPCEICPGGLTVDAGTVLPMVTDGRRYTCGEFLELAETVAGGTIECQAMQMAERFCCPN